MKTVDKTKRIMNLIKRGGLENLVGEFVEIDELNNTLIRMKEYSILDNDYENLVSTSTSTTSKMRVLSNKTNKIFDIYIRSDEGVGSYIEDIQFKDYRPDNILEEVKVILDKEKLVNQYNLPEDKFYEFKEWLESGKLKSYLTEVSALKDLVEGFKYNKL